MLWPVAGPARPAASALLNSIEHMGLVGMAVALYQFAEYEPLIQRAGEPLPVDTFVGVVSLVAVFIAAYVLMGPALPIISGCFLAYCLWGEYLPSPFNHRGYDFSQVIDHMDTLNACRDALAEGAKSALPVGIACAIVGIIVGTMRQIGRHDEVGAGLDHVDQYARIKRLD